MIRLTKNEIEKNLLTFIRNELSIQDIDYIHPPALIREGRRFHTYKFRFSGVPKEYARSLILRVYAADEVPIRPVFERTLLNALYEEGIPVPQVYFSGDTTKELSAPFIIMDEMQGEILFDVNSLYLKPYMQVARFLITGVGSIARELADIAARLHSTTVDTIFGKLKELKFPVEHLTLNGRLYQLYKRVQNGKLTGLEPGVIWLISHGPPDPEKLSICHGQLYPNHIRKLNDRISGIINWSMDSILIGDPACDIGKISAAFKCFVPNVSPSLGKISSNVGKRLSRQFIQNYLRHKPVGREKITFFEMMWCIDLAVTAGESMSASSHVYKKEFEESRIDLYKSAMNAIDYFKNTTGINVMLPLMRR